MSGYVQSPKALGLKTDCQGIYIDTNSPRIEAMMATGFLEFGVGDTRTDAEKSTIASRMRGHESSKNLGWQHYLLDSIPNPGYRDYALHREIRQTFAAQLRDPETGRPNEVFKVAIPGLLREQFCHDREFEPIRQWVVDQIRRCAANLNPEHAKQSVIVRDIQQLVIQRVLEVLRTRGVATNFVCELAARIGKTILFLELARNMRQQFGHEAMFVMAYGVGLSVRTSYQNEIGKYIDFAAMQFIDAAGPDAADQYASALSASKMPVIFVSLNPEVQDRYAWLHELSGNYIALLEETDFGTHTDSQVDKVQYILANKTATRINASGTNMGRLAKAFGQNAIDEIISIPYCMVEQDASIPNVVIRRFYNMLFSAKINRLLQDFDQDLLPNINKILGKPLSQQKFISALFQDLFGYQPIYGFNLSECAGEEIKHSMLFVNISKLAMDQLATVIETACHEHKVLILNGDYTDNKEAESLTKEELVRLRNGFYQGRDKLLVITNMMGTRSYSVPEIQACLFMQEGGDVYPYMQKYSRCLTPGFGKKFGHIFDFAFDQAKTRNTIMSVAVEAALLIRQKDKTYPQAVRQVLNSVNIKDMVSGQWIDSDQVIRQFEDNNKLLEIANAQTRLTIEDLTAEEIEAFGELAKRLSGSSKEKSKIDQTVAAGKTYESGSTATGRKKKDPLKAIVERAVRMINGSATTVLALCDYRAETFLECIDVIQDDPAMTQEFWELYGVGPDTIKRLSPRLEISTLDMIVRMSKYNDRQKHIENNALAILKDDSKLWLDVFANRKLRRFISSQQCRKILIVAGGHGSEIDVLVDMFGKDIIDKIVYNDKYGFLCNQIRRKYPGITVAQGDFTTLEFDMKFDVVVGNPPFQKDTKAKRWTLWEEFVKKSKSLADVVVMVTPQSITGPGTFKLIKDHAVVINVDVSKHFDVGSTFCYWMIDSSKTVHETQIITDNNQYQLDLSKIDFLPMTINDETLALIDTLKSRRARVWKRGELHTSNSALFSTTGKYAVMHTNAQTLKSNIEHENRQKIRVAVSLSGYPTFQIITNGYVSQACFWTECSSIEEAQQLADECNGPEIQKILEVFKWSGWNSKEVIKCL